MDPTWSRPRPLPSGPGDDELVARMARNDTEAAAELYDRLSSRVYTLVHRITGLAEDAEEVLIDSFHQAWSQARLYDPARATVTGWLLNIARSRALDLVRARCRREAREDKIGGPEELPLPQPESPEHQAMRSQTHERLHGLLSQLPEDQRQVIKLAYFGGYSHQEIADQLGEPLGTVKTRLRLGIRKIRSSVSDVEEIGG